jgi:hypothetical protein
MRDVPRAPRALSDARAYMPAASHAEECFRSKRKERFVMTFHEQAVVHETIVADTTTSLSRSIKSLADGFVAWMESCADYWAAAALYDALRKLPDSELQKRGLSRDTLARDVFHSCN